MKIIRLFRCLDQSRIYFYFVTTRNHWCTAKRVLCSRNSSNRYQVLLSRFRSFIFHKSCKAILSLRNGANFVHRVNSLTRKAFSIFPFFLFFFFSYQQTLITTLYSYTARTILISLSTRMHNKKGLQNRKFLKILSIQRMGISCAGKTKTLRNYSKSTIYLFFVFFLTHRTAVEPYFDPFFNHFMFREFVVMTQLT